MDICTCGHELKYHLPIAGELSCIFVNDFITGEESDNEQELDVCLCANFEIDHQ